jgi:hypothetical protein
MIFYVQLDRERRQSALAAGSHGRYRGGSSATFSDRAGDTLVAGIVEIDAGHIDSQ